MLFLKFFIVLTFTCLQVFGHLKNLDKIGRCVHDAASNRFEGVKYTPYKYPGHISVKDEFFEIEYSNIAIGSILDYQFTSKISPKKSRGKYITYEFQIYWKEIYINADAEGKYEDTPYKEKENYKVDMVMSGTFEYQNPKKEKYGGEITNPNINWIIHSLKVNSDLIVDRRNIPTNQFRNILKNKKSHLQDIVRDYVNKAWLSDPERIKNLFKACRIDL